MIGKEGRPGRRGRPSEEARRVGAAALTGPVAGSLVDPRSGDSLESIGGGRKTHIFNQFLADLGPFWAHNRPSGGHGLLNLNSLIESAASMGQFGAENL